MSTIKKLNDSFRTSFRGGKTFITSGVASMPDQEREQLIEKVRTFKNFNEKNDPYGEHDFGSIKQCGVLYCWKIDYYNAEMTKGSENPADPKVTTRVLTIMEAREY